MKTPVIHGFPGKTEKPRDQNAAAEQASRKNSSYSGQIQKQRPQLSKNVTTHKLEDMTKKIVKSANQDIYLHDAVRFKKDVPGTKFKAGMIGGVVEACGYPARSVDVEIDRVPIYIEHVSVEYLEKVE